MVLYFSGTGNSWYLARRIAEGLDMPLYDLNASSKAERTPAAGNEVMQRRICLCKDKPIDMVRKWVYTIPNTRKEMCIRDSHHAVLGQQIDHRAEEAVLLIPDAHVHIFLSLIHI